MRLMLRLYVDARLAEFVSPEPPIVNDQATSSAQETQGSRNLKANSRPHQSAVSVILPLPAQAAHFTG